MQKSTFLEKGTFLPFSKVQLFHAMYETVVIQAWQMIKGQIYSF